MRSTRPPNLDGKAASDLILDDQDAITKSDLEWIKAMRQEFTPERVRYFRRVTDAGMAVGILFVFCAAMVSVFGLDKIARGLLKLLQWMGADK